jgi:glyoxylate reductase
VSHRILVTRALPEGGLAPLQNAGFELVMRPDALPFTQAELIEAAAEVDGIICVLSDRVGHDVMAAGGGRLRVVANVAVGYDNIDVQAASSLDVTVCNTPGVLDEATADVAFLLLLSAARRAGEAEAELRCGKWEGWELTGYLGMELCGATLGLVGYGRIARAVERRASGFGMTVLHHTRSNTGAAGWTGSLEDLLARSDFVSLHVPLTDSTRHLIDRDRLAVMKPGSVLVNSARGPIVDEEALAEALESGHLFAAGLDVYEAEPVVNRRLLSAPHTVLLPHIGSATVTTRTQMAVMAARAIADILQGRQPHNVVSPVQH